MNLRDLVSEYLKSIGYPVRGTKPTVNQLAYPDHGWVLFFEYDETNNSLLELQIVGGFRRVTLYYRIGDRWVDAPELDSYDPDFFNKLTEYIKNKYGPPKTLSSSGTSREDPVLSHL